MNHRLAEYFVVVGYAKRLKVRTEHVDLELIEDLQLNSPNVRAVKSPTFAAKNDLLNNALRNNAENRGSEDNPFRGLKFEMEVIDRFPPKDYIDSKFERTALHQFCLPTGLSLTPETHSDLPRFYTFIWTMDTGQRLYGSCLRFVENVPPEVVRDFLETKEGESLNIEYDEKMALLAPKCICIISVHPFCQAFQRFLREIYRNSITSSPQQIPIERWICNFFQEVPLPPNGYMSVHYKINDTEIRLARPPVNNPLSESFVKIRTLFKLINLETIIDIYTALLLETKVLLLSEQYSLLAEIAESFLYLLFPFRWHHCYIPLLPSEFRAVIDAPFTYFCGSPSSLFPTFDPSNPVIPDSFNLPKDLIVLDIDSDIIWRGSKVDIPPLPRHERKKVVKALRRISSQTYDNERSCVMVQSLACELPPPPDADSKMWKQEVFQESDVREHFLRIWLSILKKYSLYINPEVKKSDVITKGALTSYQELFLNENFIDDLPAKSRAFVIKFLETQAFQNFIEAKVFENDQDKYAIRFFDEKIKEKLGRSRFTRKKPTPFLKTEAYHIQHQFAVHKPKVDDLNGRTFTYGKGWPKLQPELFYDPREKLKPKEYAPSITSLEEKSDRELLCDTHNLTEQMVYRIFFTIFLNLLKPADRRDKLSRLFKVIVQMVNEGIIPSLKLFHQIVETLGLLKWAREILSVIQFMNIIGVPPDAPFYASVLTVLSTFYGDASRAYQILGNLGKMKLDPATLGQWKLLPKEKRKRPYQTIQELQIRFQSTFPGLKMDTAGQCMVCGEKLHDLHVRLGWSTNINDRCTQCPRCNQLFVSRWRLRGSTYTVQFKEKPLGLGLCEGRYPNEVYIDKVNNKFAETHVNVGDQVIEVIGQPELNAKFSHQELVCFLKKSAPPTLKFQKVSWGDYVSPVCIMRQIADVIHKDGVFAMVSKDFRLKPLYWSLAWEFSCLKLPPVLEESAETIECSGGKQG